MKQYWTPDKVTALILIVGCFALLFTGIDGEIKAILAISAGWLFGGVYSQRHSRGKDNGKDK